MAAIKVHGSIFSTNTQRVLACLHEKELEYDYVFVNMRVKEHKQEPFLSLNPFGKVPVLEHGDFKLFESRAITEYIAHEFPEKGTQLIIPGSKNMATLAMWKQVEAHQYDTTASKLAWEQVYKPMFGDSTDSKAVEENEAILAKVLDIYETRLSQSKYLAGESFSLADLHHLPVTQMLLGTETKKLFDSRLHVSAWVADITARPSWSKVLAMKKQ